MSTLSTAPIVSWRDEQGALLTSWEIGEIDAGEASAVKKLFIWNNFPPAEPTDKNYRDVAHMQDCTITITDGAGNVAEPVKKKWVKVRCVSKGEIGEQDYKRIGGHEGGVNELAPYKHPIGAANLEEYVKGKDGTNINVIQGDKNTGSLALDKKNYAEVDAVFQSELYGIDAGPRNFRLRVDYYYI